MEGCKLHGYGTYTYQGERIQVPSYQGHWQRAEGSKYVGEWKNGNKDGYGIYTYANGDRDGFLDIHGVRTRTRTNGSKYVGEYKDGERHGQGTKTKASSMGKYIEHSGEWVNGEPKK